jgi:hypothetical protein
MQNLYCIRSIQDLTRRRKLRIVRAFVKFWYLKLFQANKTIYLFEI